MMNIMYQIYQPIKSLRRIGPCINGKTAIKFLSELMENIIVKEDSAIEGLMFSEEFMALVIFTKNIEIYFHYE